MANIKVSNLQPKGFDLLSDVESYLQEVSNDGQLDRVVGGTSVIIISSDTIRQFFEQF
jgi:hypothetical protein